MIDLSKLNELGGGVPQSEAIRPKLSIEKQQELERERDRYLKEQRERIANTSALKLEIVQAFKNGVPAEEVAKKLIECVAIATNDKSFINMCG